MATGASSPQMGPQHHPRPPTARLPAPGPRTPCGLMERGIVKQSMLTGKQGGSKVTQVCEQSELLPTPRRTRCFSEAMLPGAEADLHVGGPELDPGTARSRGPTNSKTKQKTKEENESTRGCPSHGRSPLTTRRGRRPPCPAHSSPPRAPSRTPAR